MAFVREQKPGGMARAKQVSEGLGNLASGAMRLQALGQQQQQLDMQKAEQPVRLEEMRARAQQMRANAEMLGAEMEQQRLAIKQRAMGGVMNGLAYMTDSFGNIQDDKLKNEAFDAYLNTQGRFLFDQAKMAGLEEASDPVAFKSWLKSNGKVLAPIAAGLRQTGSELNRALLGPDRGYDAKAAAKMYADLELRSRQYIGLMPGAADALQSELTNVRKLMDEKNARLTAAGTAGARLAAGNDPADDATKLFKLTQQGTLGKLNELSSMTSAIDQNMSAFIANPSGYGDFGILMQGLKGLQADTSVIREAEMRLGKNATSLINKALNFAEELHSGKSLQPEQRKQMQDVFAVMKDSYRSAYQKAAMPVAKQAQAKGVPLNMIFADPSLFEPASGVENAPITGQQAAPAAAPKAAGPSAAMRQFMIQDE